MKKQRKYKLEMQMRGTPLYKAARLEKELGLRQYI